MVAISSHAGFVWGKGVVEAFSDSTQFPVGSDVVCFSPVGLGTADCLQKMLVLQP